MIQTLLFLAVISFIQNMAFTFSSRSRNSGSPSHHFKAALGSNSIWFVCNYFILFPEILKITETGDIKTKLAIMAVYVVSTALGSIFMMALNLGKIKIPFLSEMFEEKGKAKVGSR